MYLKIITFSCILTIQIYHAELLESLLSKEIEEGLKAREIVGEFLKAKDTEKNSILEKLVNVGEEMGVIKYKLKLHERLKWFVTAREAILNTEERFAKNVPLDIPTNITDIFERSKEEHRQRFMYILEHKKNESVVLKLNERIENYGISVHDFCCLISEAHYCLSKIIQNTVMKKGDFEIYYGYEIYDVDEREKVNEALKILLEEVTTKKNFAETI